MQIGHKHSWAAAATLALLCLPAHAQPSAAIDLRWRAPHGCPTHAEIEAQLPRTAAPLRVDVVVTRIAADRQRAQLRFEGALEAERELEGDSCAALADACVWLISDVSARIPADSPPTAAELDDEEDHSLQPTAAASIGASAWLDSAALPHPTPGVALELALRHASWRFAARPRFWLPQSRELAQTSVQIGLAELVLQACYGFATGGLWVGPCASAAAGVAWASARATQPAGGRFGPWLALEAAVAAEWSFTPRWFAGLELAGVHPVWFPRISITAAAAGPAPQTPRLPASGAFCPDKGAAVRLN